MDFHELAAFRVLAREKHFAHAAAALNMSPSALSRLVARLEAESGYRLIDRDTRTVRLTREGEEFLSFTQEVLLRRGDLPARLAASAGQLGGSVRLYASVTACYSIVPPFAEALHRTWPSLRLEVETGDPAEGARRVREEQADIAVSALPAGGYPDLDSWSVYRTPLVFASSTRGPWHLSNPARLEDLEAIPLILPRAGLARERLDRAQRKAGIVPQIAAETAGNEALLALVRLGLGIGLVPSLVLEQGPFADGLEPFTCPALGDYDIGFIQRKTGGGPRGARLREALASLIENDCGGRRHA